MSGYEKIETIKAEVENFKNTKFYSMDGETSVVVENTINGSRFSVPYMETENGIVFDGEKAIQTREKQLTPQEKFSNDKMNLQKTINGIFEDGKYEDSIKNLKGLIADLPPVDPEVIYIQQLEKEEEKPVYEGVLAEKVNAYIALKDEHQKSLNLFDEDQNVVKSKIGSAAIKKMECELETNIKYFIEAAEAYQGFKTDLTKIVEDEKVREKLLSDLDLESDISISVPKTLVVAKNTINEDLNVLETSSKILSSWKTHFFNEDLTPALQNDKLYNFTRRDQERPRFLKFHSGVFTVEDAITLSEELDHAMSFYLGDLDDEDLMFIANKKHVVEYMVRTRRVSDRVMMATIEEFNKRFAKNVEDEYLQSQRGFKSNDDMNAGKIEGMADRKVEA